VLACGAPSAPPGRHQVVIAFAAEPAALNPIFVSDNLSFTISGWLFNGLTRIQPDLKVAADLAEGWQLGRNGRRLTFFLRKGVKWHDGEEFTAADVVFTYRQVTSPGTPTPLKCQFGPVRQVSAPDRYTVVVDYEEPFGSALESWTIGIVPEHVFKSREVTDPSFDRAPVGTGPYRLKEWLPGQKLVLTSFPEHFRGSPRLPQLIIKIIPDPTTRFLELKTGHIDVMELSPAQYAEWQKNPPGGPELTLYRCEAVRYGFLGFNHLHPAFREREIRQAFSMAIDKTAIIQGVLKGLGSVGHSPFPPKAWYSHDSLPSLPFDPSKAKEIFQKWGFALMSAIEPGSPLILATNYESKENLLTAQIIQENLQALGVTIRIRTYDWLTFRHVVINKRQFDLIVLERHFLWDPDLYTLWHSSQIKEGEWNFLNYHNPEVDRLLAEGRRTLEKDRRRALYRQLQEIMAQDLPCVFLYNSDAVFLARKALHGISPSPLGIFDNVAQWYFGTS